MPGQNAAAGTPAAIDAGAAAAEEDAINFLRETSSMRDALPKKGSVLHAGISRASPASTNGC
jgi:hypothetical protein